MLSLRELLPSPPDDNDYDTITVKAELPRCTTIRRNFRCCDTLQVNYPALMTISRTGIGPDSLVWLRACDP